MCHGSLRENTPTSTVLLATEDVFFVIAKQRKTSPREAGHKRGVSGVSGECGETKKKRAHPKQSQRQAPDWDKNRRDVSRCHRHHPLTRRASPHPAASPSVCCCLVVVGQPSSYFRKISNCSAEFPHFLNRKVGKKEEGEEGRERTNNKHPNSQQEPTRTNDTNAGVEH